VSIFSDRPRYEKERNNKKQQQKIVFLFSVSEGREKSCPGCGFVFEKWVGGRELLMRGISGRCQTTHRSSYLISGLFDPRLVGGGGGSGEE
jgi:hypothetical protein